jgi:hypothetical protein
VSNHQQLAPEIGFQGFDQTLKITNLKDLPPYGPGNRVLVQDLSYSFTVAKPNYVICQLVNAYVEKNELRYSVAALGDQQGGSRGHGSRTRPRSPAQRSLCRCCGPAG